MGKRYREPSHAHRCGRCGIIWRHTERLAAELVLFDKLNEYEAGHVCPACGSEDDDGSIRLLEDDGDLWAAVSKDEAIRKCPMHLMLSLGPKMAVSTIAAAIFYGRKLDEVEA